MSQVGKQSYIISYHLQTHARLLIIPIARSLSLSLPSLNLSETYSFYFGKSPYERIKISQLDLSKLPIEGLTQLECGGQGADIDTAWNEELTPRAARLATGCVIEAASCVAKGRLQNAFAIVRPPGKRNL